jgi:hypothetical protein
MELSWQRRAASARSSLIPGVDRQCFVNSLVEGQLAVSEDSTALAIFAQRFGRVGGHDKRPLASAARQCLLRSLAETFISGSGYLVDEVAVEADGKADCKGKSSLHAAGVALYWLMQIGAELREFLHISEQGGCRTAIDARDEPRIVSTGKARLEGAGVSDRPGNAHLPANLACGRIFDARNQSQERRLAGAIGSANADRFAASDRKIGVAQDRFSQFPCVIGHADVREADHCTGPLQNKLGSLARSGLMLQQKNYRFGLYGKYKFTGEVN